jgi:hypothetical protein
VRFGKPNVTCRLAIALRLQSGLVPVATRNVHHVAGPNQVQIRAGSVVGPLHHPLRIAEEWAVVDNPSRWPGRHLLRLRLARHGLRLEAYADRKDNTLQAVDQLRRLCRGEQIDAVDGNGRPCRLGVILTRRALLGPGL